jgi:hypothetical protein
MNSTYYDKFTSENRMFFYLEKGKAFDNKIKIIYILHQKQ